MGAMALATVVFLSVGAAPAPRFFGGASVGVSWTTVHHPALAADFFGPAYSVQGGASLSDHFQLSAQMEGLARYVSRTEGRPFALAELVASGADCTSCRPKVLPGFVAATIVSFTTLSLRFDYAPFGKTGPFLAATGGLSVMDGFPPDAALSSPLGGTIGGRAGFRYRFNPVLELLGELALQAQFYRGASVTSASAGGAVRLYL